MNEVNKLQKVCQNAKNGTQRHEATEKIYQVQINKRLCVFVSLCLNLFLTQSYLIIRLFRNV